MTKRMIIPLLFGILGTAILISLGVWQVQRLAWKEAMLTDITARISREPVALPEVPDARRDLYLPVSAEGELTGEGLVVLASLKQVGAIYLVISVLDLGERRVMVDRGYRSVLGHASYSSEGHLNVAGNLHWPDEVDGFTPEPEDKGGTPLFFARDVVRMAAVLDTEPVLIVARDLSPTDADLTPLPVTIQGIPNDHLQYAIAWFLLAIVWVGMTLFLLWCIRQRTI